MKDQVLARMDALGCAPSLRRLVAQLPDPTRIVVKPASSVFRALITA